MSIWFIAQGATAPPLVAQLVGGDGLPVNLAGATVQLRLYQRLGDVALLAVPMTVLDAANGQVQYDWASGGTATAGEFIAQFWVTFASGATERFPDPGNDLVHVDPS